MNRGYYTCQPDSLSMQALRYTQEHYGKLSRPYLCMHLLTCESTSRQKKAYQYLSRPSQLKCIMDDHTKNVIWGLKVLYFTAQEIFLLEPVAIFVGN